MHVAVTYLREAGGTVMAFIMATGSEMGLVMEPQMSLSAEDIQYVWFPCQTRAVSWQQDEAYRDSVLLPTCKARVAVEAGVGQLAGRLLSVTRAELSAIDSFGASAPANELFEFYGLTVENVSQASAKSAA